MLITSFIVLIATIAVADFHADWYKNNKPIYWWWHPLWVLPFILFAIGDGIDHHNIYYGIMVFAPRGIFFSPILNLLRKKPFFYLSAASSNPSIIDKVLLTFQVIYPYIWILLCVSYVLFLCNIISF